MNILVIGNGFDLAHGLPTKYTDFLFFCKVINCIIKDNEIERKIVKIDKYNTIWIDPSEELSFKKIKSIEDFVYNVSPLNSNANERDKKVYNEIINNFIREYLLGEGRDQKLVKDIICLIFNNFWINYFLQCNMHGNENWIDFESEISNVVKCIDKKMRDEKCNLYDSAKLQRGHYMEQLFMEKYGSVSYKGIRDKLEGDLNKLIRAFEIYLTEYVEKIEIQEKSLDINDLEIDFILSFNYTHIFSKLYDVSSQSKQEIADDSFDYIHGQVDAKNSIESNNMVLGIDEYLGKKRRNKDIEFVKFKKYYQRVYKGTGSKYEEWINVIREENNIYMERKHDCEIYIRNIDVLTNIKEEKIAELKQLNENPPSHNVYIFGHSLDITDKDILRELILNDNVYTTIYYPDKEELGRKIANLIKVIGQDELIRRTGGNTKTIEFKQQQDMVNI